MEARSLPAEGTGTRRCRLELPAPVRVDSLYRHVVLLIAASPAPSSPRRHRTAPPPRPLRNSLSPREKSGRMSLLLSRVPEDDDSFDIDITGHFVFFEVEHVSFDLGHLAADRSSFTNHLNLFAHHAFQKVLHGF